MNHMHGARRYPQSFSVLLACVSCALATAVPARAGLIIDPTYDTASFTAAGYNITAVENAFAYAATEFENEYSNPIHVNIEVKAGSTGLGQSDTILAGYFTYSQVRSALVTNNPFLSSSLPTTDPTGTNRFLLATAEAKALGLALDDSVTSDGTFTFSNTASYTFNSNNRQVSGKYDFIGIAEHEISEIMGRIALLGHNFGAGASYDANDLYRYTAAGVESLSASASNVYFSLDKGTTDLQGFNGPSGGDVDDYNGSSATDPFNAFTGTDQGHSISAVDITNMEAIGYTVTPEPTSVALVTVGALLLTGYGRRRLRRSA
jgi:hypothetical protein